MKKARLIVTVAGLACCSIALAKPPLELAQPGASIEPVSVAKVKRVNGTIVLDGGWVPYGGGTTRTSHIHRAFCDSMGVSAQLVILCQAGTQCTTGCTTAWLDGHTDDGTRWFFGSAYHNPNTIEDMQDCECPPNSVISEIDLSWFWCPTGGSERCIIVYFPFEEVLAFDPVPGVCNDPNSFTDTGGGGVAIDFGVLVAGCPFYYFSCVSGIEELGLLSPGTDDNGDPNGWADGSYQMIIANAISSSQITLASGPTQPMLWGTSRGFNGTQGTNFNPGAPAYPGDCRPGLNNGDSYDDDAPTDGVFSNPAECYDYTYGLCPDPLGKANTFAYQRCTADFNNDGFVDGIDADQFNNAFEAGDICTDINGDCFVDGIDSDNFNNAFEALCF